MSNKFKFSHPIFSSLKVFFLTLAIAFAGIFSAQATDLNLADHTIRWTGSTLVKSHTGLLSPKSITATISESGVIEELDVVLDMSSIDVTDLEGRGKNRLTGHLMSEDFFHVSEYPEARFVMKELKDGRMHGTITIRGIAQPIAIPVKVASNADSGWKLSGSFAFDRQKHNVNYANAGIIGIAKDKIIDNDIELDIELELK